MTIDLFTVSDVKKVREELTKRQDNLDAITGLEIPTKQHVLDHCHDDNQYVRAVLHRQSNAALGKIENLYVRYLRHWYPYDLPTFLRQCADYLDQPVSNEYRHPGWIKKICTLFNSLKESEKKQVLSNLGKDTGKNPAERKLLFKKAILTKDFTYDTLRFLIISAKE